MLLDNFLRLKPCYQERPLKEHNGSSVSSNPLAANQAHFASLAILQSKKTPDCRLISHRPGSHYFPFISLRYENRLKEI